MKLSGERLVPGIPRLENMIVEELARLNFVRHHLLGQVVLDAGCGTGYATEFLAEIGARWVLGVDISEEAITCASANRSRRNLAFAVMDCTTLALDDESFDMVCSLELIEHLADSGVGRRRVSYSCLAHIAYWDRPRTVPYRRIQI